MKIRDLAIIDELELELGSGLNVLTGETGAGKSILVSALELVLGGRGRPELVRSGARAAEVEALFEVNGDERLRQKLEALELQAGGELVVRRVLSSCGRTRAFINGKLATQQALAEITRGLTDISSQHEHHTLSDPGTHLGYLDAFAGVLPLRQRMTKAYQSLRQAEQTLRDFADRLRDREAREAVLSAQLKEIEEAAPELLEDTLLEQTCSRLRNAEKLSSLVAEAVERLYEGDGAVVDSLAQASSSVTEAAELDPPLASLAAQLDVIQSQLEDVARELVRHMRSVRADPEALQRAEERSYLLSKLKRRYGGSLEDVLAHVEKGRAELEELTEHAATSEALELAQRRALEAAESIARALSAERQRAAEELGVAISRELESLGMGGARVHVELRAVREEQRPRGGAPPDNEDHETAGELTLDGARLYPSSVGAPTHALSADGLERAEFLIAPNRGEEARSLHKVASGGELSRAMLAIKCVLADLGPAGMYAFDEMDTGVGGGMAEIIGRKIKSIAQHRQVLCITHLPHIAVFADHHFKVEKCVRAERTLSTVRRLTEREQSEEIARMLGGLKITAKTRAAARELLREAKKRAA